MSTITGRPRLVLVLGLALVALAALAVVAVNAAVSAAATRPFAGQIALHAVVTEGSCPPGGNIVVLEGGGSLSILGATTIEAANCAAPMVGGGSSPIVDGTATYRALDGSSLTVSYQGHQSPLLFESLTTFAVTQEVTGGTGRFANASGKWEIFGTVDLATGLLLGDVEGWVRY